ncbi:hypothetical protein [Phycicoccus endophyticus]|nr:hypothetical protein [Phycicoccus endophyticus]
MTPRTGRRRSPSDVVRYEFRLDGRLSETVTAAFPELEEATAPTEGTVLFGEVEDEAHLYGLLERFQTLGIPVQEMRRLPD